MSLDCRHCNRTFNSNFSRNQHVAASPAHAAFACIPCGKQFVSDIALAQHSNSQAHIHLTPDLRCPRCQQRFPSGPSALLMHLESGGRCAKRLKLTRTKITRFVMDADTSRVITALSSNNANTTVRAIIMTVDINEDDDIIELPRHICEECPADRGQFPNALALFRHKNSPAHDPIVFNCPARANMALDSSQPRNEQNEWIDETFDRHQRGFKTLSGLAQHLEKGACDGGMQTFYDALESVTKKLGKMGLYLRGV